jgi:DNA polymerase III alpha subunit (gram-positive type)
MTLPDLYFSVDVETDGPIPGPNSLLSIGAAAFLKNGTMASVFTVNLKTLSDATPDKKTMEFWAGQPEAWAAHRTNTAAPEVGTGQFLAWVETKAKQYGGSPVFVAYPAGFDFLFVYWYLIRFCGRSPFSFSVLDIKTYAMATIGGNYRSINKKKFPKEWTNPRLKHNHVALDDAIEQGEIFMKMLAQRERESQQVKEGKD